MEERKIIIITVFAALLSFVRCDFTISLSTDGTYNISVNKDMWVQSGPTFFYANAKRYSQEDGSLKIDHVSYSTSGIDRLGPWQDSQAIYRADGLVFKNTIKTYQTDALPLIIFRQTFFNATTKTRSPSVNRTISSFPSMKVLDLGDKVGYLSYGGEMMGDMDKKFGRWSPSTLEINDGLNGGPLVMFDKHGNTIIMAPFSNFMEVSLWHDTATNTISWGVMGGVDTIPAGFEVSFVFYYTDQGINKAFEDLGSRMRYWYKKTDYYSKLDNTLNYVGYWTDNGAYYYYHTENNNTANYEQTLIDVNTYSKMSNIPYKYIQLDSWWYKKGSLAGVTEWSPLPGLFPDGLQFFHNKTQWSLAAHNRYWSRNATYAKQNGGKYNFIMGKEIALPDDPEFWNFLLSEAKRWGLVLYEQDWLNAQLLGLEALQSDLDLGQRWLEQMGQAAQANDITIQYCMSLPREAMQSLTVPAVTQVRVTDDYHLQEDQWKIGVTSLFAYAMGLAPSKDTFWTTEVQPNNPYDRDCNKTVTPGDVSKCKNATEPYPALQVLVSTLSTGPVGPGDMINGTDRDLLMKCCSDDGLVLKPSKPATAIDDQIIEAAFQDGSGADGEVWTTYADYEDLALRFGIILAVNTSRDYIITRRRAGLIPFLDKYKTVLFPANDSQTLIPFDDQHPFTIPACSLTSDPYFCLYYTSPVINIGSKEVIILGELDKWVPMSPQRVVKIWVTSDAVALTLRGQPGETITLTSAVDDAMNETTMTVETSGCANWLIFKTTSSAFSFPASQDCTWEVTTTPAPPTPTSTTSTTATTTTMKSSVMTTAKHSTTTSDANTICSRLNIVTLFLTFTCMIKYNFA